MDWISIKKEQPKDGEKVIVWLEPRNGRMSSIFGFWDNENKRFSVPGAYTSEYDVRYWMPEPKNPDEYKSAPNLSFIDIEDTLDACDSPKQFTLKVRKNMNDEGRIVWDSSWDSEKKEFVAPVSPVFPYSKKDVSSYYMVEYQVLINALALLEEISENHSGKYAMEKLDIWAHEESELIAQTIGDIYFSLENDKISATILTIENADWMGFYVNDELVIQGDREFVYSHMMEKFFDEIGIGKENLKHIVKSEDWINENGGSYCPEVLGLNDSESDQ